MRFRSRIMSRANAFALGIALLVLLSVFLGQGFRVTRTNPQAEVTPTSVSGASSTATALAGTPTSQDATPTAGIPFTGSQDPAPTPTAPLASFDADLRSGTAPLAITFTDLSEGEVDSLEWDFGDGFTSQDPSPVHEYEKSGTHTVRLTVTGPNGTDSRVRTSFITVHPGPIVGLAITPEHATVPVSETVRFAALAVDEFGNGVPVPAAWSLDADGSELSNEGLFTAGTLATTLTDAVTATSPDGEHTASASVTVTPGPLASVTIGNRATHFTVRGSHRFTFTAADAHGNSIDDAVGLWAVSPNAGGINGSGEFRAGTTSGLYPNAVSLVVASRTVRVVKRMDVDLRPDVLDSISIEPSASEVIWNHELQFTAYGMDRYGNAIDDLAVVWSTEGGSVSETGLFTAGMESGTFAVRATGFQGVMVTGETNVVVPAPRHFFQRQWPELPTQYQVTGFARIAVDQAGVAYITSSSDGNVLKVSPDRVVLIGWGVPGNGDSELNGPQGVAIDSLGNVYVADVNNNRIQKFTAWGTFVAGWGDFGTGNGQFNWPTDIAIDDADQVYVADRLNHRVQVFSSDGTFLRKWGSQGTGTGNFRKPVALSITPDGNLLVAEKDGHRLQEFTPDGEFDSAWGQEGTAPGQFGLITDVAHDRFGNVYVADSGNHRIQLFDPDGQYLSMWGSQGDGPGQFQDLAGIAVTNDGFVIVVDNNDPRVQEFVSPAITDP